MNAKKIAKKIIRKIKGWNLRDEQSDFEDHPAVHLEELKWVIRELEKIASRARNEEDGC